MGTALRERLRAAERRRFKTFAAPIVGEVRLRSLTAREVAAIRAKFSKPDGEPNSEAIQRMRHYLIAACLCDDDGNPCCALDDVDRGGLDDLDGGVLDALFAACRDHTGFAAEAGWSAVVDAAKN